MKLYVEEVPIYDVWNRFLMHKIKVPIPSTHMSLTNRSPFDRSPLPYISRDRYMDTNMITGPLPKEWSTFSYATDM